MKVVIDDQIRRVDEVLFGVFRFVNLIRHVNPTNVDEEKEAFFSGERRNPVFQYKPPRRDINDLKNTLRSLEIPDTHVGKIYAIIRDQFLKQCEVIENVGVDDNVVRDLTSEIYGWPNEGLVEYAKRILLETPGDDTEYRVPAEVIAGSVQKMYDEIGLNDWTIRFSKKRLTTAKNTRKVTICETRMFSELDVHRLPVHEVGVHATRYANGYTQPLRIFVFGFPDFLKTEEGLATYMEEATGNMNPLYFRNYAGRVLAVNCLHRNLDFRDCFEELVKHGFSEDDAWNLSVRAYRGGGFVKDHVYLEGYVLVREFIKHGGDVQKLFVGKVGIEDFPLIEEMLTKKVILPPQYLPPFLR